MDEQKFNSVIWDRYRALSKRVKKLEMNFYISLLVIIGMGFSHVYFYFKYIK